MFHGVESLLPCEIIAYSPINYAEPLWLIKSKQRAFNPIHVCFFFSLHREQPVKHNQIPHAKQRGGRRQPHLLSGVASGKLTVREQLAAQMVEMERLREKPL